MTKIKNLGVLIEPIIEQTEKKVGLIIVPDTVNIKAKFRKGIVRGVGNGTQDRPMEVSAGETVMYKNADYPQSGGWDVVSLDDILYVI